MYQPLEQLYLVLVTNKGSNIIEDLDTLRLLAKVVPDTLPPGTAPTEEAVTARAFELLFAFDEVLAPGGLREDVTLHQIRTNLEMESHEEKLHAMIKASKMAEAKEAAKRKAAEIRDRHREEEKLNRGANRLAVGDSNRFTGSSGGGYGDDASSNSPSFRSSSARAAEAAAAAVAATADTASSAKRSGGGLRLGAKKGGVAGGGKLAGAGGGGLAGLMAEEGLADKDLLAIAAGGGSSAASGSGGASSAAAAVAAATATAASAAADHANIVIEEHLTARVSRDGGVESVDVKGTLSLTVADDASARMKLVLDRGAGLSAFQVTTHPNVNKALFAAEGIVALKAPDRPFPVGAPLGVLRWRFAEKGGAEAEAVLPLTLNVWPEEGAGGVINVNIEYTLTNTDLTLLDVVVTVPLGDSDATPRIVSIDGTHKHNTRANVLTWHVPSISADNASGTLEFNIKGRNTDAFFPVTVAFTASETLCPLGVAQALSLDDGRTLRAGITKSLVVDSYEIT